ncbi:PREDICTED: uncharacterized protein LOC101295130 [Fragaria vesca subsp. vesca]|uniref:uncharacterized protein LOC101295130 n=1 Tax=Fragaria vesca subsp. vesca TaxID=101020 RepID=UPI0002C31333|nr:PREDICTED: uncharacterized protein LOC101295130 [Fragaria vesca subsp. vesca]
MGIALLSVQAPHYTPLPQFHYTNTTKSWRTFSRPYPLESKSTILLCSTSSSSVVEDTTLPPDDSLAAKSESSIKEPPFSACKSCGREEMEKGCNGEGSIQGGIATFPGFGWWPIKAYRPCPGFLESGGRYRRQGQSLDEVAFGRGGRGEN